MTTSSSPIPQKSGFAVLIGRSNVGKSTLLNTLVGTKVAITTPKPQTTRQPIQGILSTNEGQIVFVDTPGIFKEAKDRLSKKLLQYVKQSLQEIDVIVYVVDPTRSIGAEERWILSLIREMTVPKLLIINKMDKQKKPFVASYQNLSSEFTQTIEISAERGWNVNRVVEAIFERIPEGEPYYPPGQFTSMPTQEWIAEIIREKLFLRLREEVPYAIHVVVDEIERRENGMLYIAARILTNEERYKRMIIGSKGHGLTEIGQSVRSELETVMQTKIYLALQVETNEHWLEQFL